jgi:hypothetical protein
VSRNAALLVPVAVLKSEWKSTPAGGGGGAADDSIVYPTLVV